MAEFEIVTEGLRFPEGPVAMPDGSVILTEIANGRITRVYPDGRKETVAETGGGPNGLALGPDGKLYCCNNGGFEYLESNGYLAPHGIADDYSGGRIERIDIATGTVEVLYKSGDFGCVLRGPNDIVFDAHGGFWFTDHGKVDYVKRCHDIVGIFYAKADGSHRARFGSRNFKWRSKKNPNESSATDSRIQLKYSGRHFQDFPLPPISPSCCITATLSMRFQVSTIRPSSLKR